MKTDSRFALVQRSLAGVVLAGVLLGMWGGATPGSPPAGSTEPVIDSVTPDSAAEGAVVTIRGANFGPSVGAVQGTSGVSFNGVWSTPSSWSESSITVAVPPGAETGEVVVTVSGRPSAGVEFTVTGEGASGPAIGTVSPALGLEGTMVTIRGANFGSKVEMGGVSFNGVWASATSWSDEEIRVPVPADATTGGVVVRADGQASNGVAFMVTDSGLGEPVIDFLSADSGPAGMVVTIEGSNFGPSIGAFEGTSGVSFNGVWGQPTYWSDRVIQVPVPAGAPSGLVTVAAGVEASNGVAFVVERSAPVIEAVDSSFGPEGTRVEITGRNFGPAMEASQGWSGVSFDGVWGVPAYWSDREIHVAVPAGVSRSLIVVTSVGQESNGIPFAVARAKTRSRAVVAASTASRAAPVITKLKEATGATGAGVRIKGSNFGDEQGGSTVTFNGTPVENYVKWGDTKIDVKVPSDATTGPVVVTVGGVASNGVTFTVTGSESSAPTISSLEPDSGPEGTSVVITGTNFGATKGTSTVSFNEAPATPTNWSDTSITVAVPMGATTGNVVVTVDGEASDGVTFTVTPAISSLSPIAGPEGTSVVITGTSFGAMRGTSFGAMRGTSTVEFNETEVATYTSWSGTSITVPVPANATTGPVVVTVGGEASNGVTFTVGTDPVISSVRPASGPIGTTVAIAGANFGASKGTSRVEFNGAEATPANWSDTAITVAVPMGAATGNVVVTVDGTPSNGVAFTVTPVISSLSPVAGPEGTPVVITGTSFGAMRGTNTVTFNGTPAETYTSWSDTSDHGAGAGECDDRPGSGDGRGRGEQRGDLHRGDRSGHQLRKTGVRSDRDDGCDRGRKFRRFQGDEQGRVQRGGSDAGQLERHLDHGDGAGERGDGQRGGDGGRDPERRGGLHRDAGDQQLEPGFGPRGGVGHNHRHELRSDAGGEHGDLQRDAGRDLYELERHLDHGNGAGECDDGTGGGDGGRACEQRGGLHRGDGPDRHFPESGPGAGGNVGRDQRREFRPFQGDQHGNLQRRDGRAEHLERHLDHGAGAGDRDDGTGVGDGRGGCEQSGDLHRNRTSAGDHQAETR